MNEQIAKLHRRIKIVIWVGIGVNMLFVIPMCFFPAFLLDLLAIELNDLIWARAAGMLLFIISVFYIPATWDVNRYRANAWFHCFPSRLFGFTFFTVAVFFFDYEWGFLSIAIVDGVFLLLVLLLMLQLTNLEKAAGEPVPVR